MDFLTGQPVGLPDEVTRNHVRRCVGPAIYFAERLSYHAVTCFSSQNRKPVLNRTIVARHTIFERMSRTVLCRTILQNCRITGAATLSFAVQNQSGTGCFVEFNFVSRLRREAGNSMAGTPLGEIIV